MFIIQLCLAVIPLLYITTANGDIFIGHAVEDFSVDSNATIMAFGNPQGACKFMFLDPKSNTTCCYSTNTQELCHTDRQSSSCRSPETAVMTASINGGQLLLISYTTPHSQSTRQLCKKCPNLMSSTLSTKT